MGYVGSTTSPDLRGVYGRLGKLIIYAGIWILPIAVTGRAYWRYRNMQVAGQDDLVRTRTSLALISLSAIAWIVNMALMSMGEHYRVHVPFGSLIFVNLLLNLGAILLSSIKRQFNPSTVPVKKAVAFSGTTLLLLW